MSSLVQNNKKLSPSMVGCTMKQVLNELALDLAGESAQIKPVLDEHLGVSFNADGDPIDTLVWGTCIEIDSKREYVVLYFSKEANVGAEEVSKSFVLTAKLPVLAIEYCNYESKQYEIVGDPRFFSVNLKKKRISGFLGAVNLDSIELVKESDRELLPGLQRFERSE